MVLQDVTIFSNKDNNPLLKMQGQRQKLKHRFEVCHKLGQGTYGKVQLAIDKDNGQQVAIKTIKKSKIETEQDLIRIRREIQIMSSVQHPHIIHIYEVFENKEKIVLVMQYASGGELYDYLNEKKVLAEGEARRLFRQIASAVYYCHKNKICHRDLKLENIFLDEKGNAKIGDFGLSNVYDNRHFLTTFCGSPLYASPEIVQGTPYYGSEVDCWSMGVLLYTLVYGGMPFDGSNFKKLVKQISDGDYYEPKKKSEASGLIREILTVSPSKRANIVDICSHWWVNEGCEHSLAGVAEDLANLTPVRLDFLIALAPPVTPTDEPEVGANEILTSATEPSVQNDKKTCESESKDGMNEYVNGEVKTIKRRSLSVPDIAERAMDFLIPSIEKDMAKQSSPKRRDDNDSTSSVITNDGRKKKPRMGVSALMSDVGSADVLKAEEGLMEKVESSEHEEAVLKEKDSVEPDASELPENDKSPDLNNMDINGEAKTADEAPKEEAVEEVYKEPEAEEAAPIKTPPPENKPRRSSISPKKSVKSTKPNLVKKVKKKKDDVKAKEEVGRKSKSPDATKPTKEEPEVKAKPNDRIVKRPKKLKIPLTPMYGIEPTPPPERKKVPGKISDLKKAFESGKSSPKRPLIVPSYKVSDAKKAFEDKKAASPPVSEIRRKSSVTSPIIRKLSIVGDKKESSPGKELPKAGKTVKSKLSNSRSNLKPVKRNGSKTENPESVPTIKKEEIEVEESKVVDDLSQDESVAEEASQASSSLDERGDRSEEIEEVTSIPESQENNKENELFIREEGDDLKESKTEEIDPEVDLKMSAKDILKRNIAKAKLTERRSSQQSVSDDQQPEHAPPAGFYTPPVVKTAFKLPKPYSKEDGDQKISTASIVLKRNKEEYNENLSKELPKCEPKVLFNNNPLSNRQDSISGTPADAGHAIAKSFRKFTFTKDGKCIEETGKIFQNDPNGEWTTIETKTVKTNSKSGLPPAFNAGPSSHKEDDFGESNFERRRIERSDSTSSSGPDDIFEDFFDSVSSDSMFLNLKRMNSMMKKHFGHRNPLFQKHSNFNYKSPFRKMNSSRRRSSSQTRSSKLDHDSQNEDTDNEVDTDSPFSATGSQNIQKLLKDFNKDTLDDFFQNRFSTLGRQSRKSSRPSTQRSDTGRQSIFDSFMAAGDRPASSSSYVRSMSNDRSNNNSSTGLSSHNITQDIGDNSNYSQPRNSSYSYYPSTDSRTGSYTPQSEYMSGNPHYTQFSRQNSSFSNASGPTHQTYTVNTGPEINRNAPHVITHRFTRSDSANIPSYEDSSRKSSTSSNAFSRQSSEGPKSVQAPPDSGFRATIKLSRSGIEPPEIQHSAYGTIRPHIRIRYTRSASGGIPDGQKPPTSSNKCQDGVHCGTPEREIVDEKCTDGKHCGTPPPEEDVKYESPSIYGTMKPRDIKKYIKMSDENSGSKQTWQSQDVDEKLCDFDARPDEEENNISANTSADEPDHNSKCEQVSPPTMSLLESLKAFGYKDVMKIRQSQEDLRSNQNMSNRSLNYLSLGQDPPNRAKSEETSSSDDHKGSEIRSESEEPPPSSESESSEVQDGAESVSDRIRRKSYFTRFNDDRSRRTKKAPLSEISSRRNSGYLSGGSFDNICGLSDYPSSRRTSYSHSFSRDSSFDQPDPLPKSYHRNGHEWFQEAEARASQMLEEMYEHDAKMLQSLPLRNRSSKKSGYSSDSDRKNRRPKHYDNYQPSSGYLSNLHKSEREPNTNKSPSCSNLNGNSLIDDFVHPKDVLKKAMDLLNS